MQSAHLSKTDKHALSVPFRRTVSTVEVESTPGSAARKRHPNMSIWSVLTEFTHRVNRSTVGYAVSGVEAPLL